MYKYLVYQFIFTWDFQIECYSSRKSVTESYDEKLNGQFVYGEQNYILLTSLLYGETLSFKL